MQNNNARPLATPFPTINMSKKRTLRDLARAAKVSPATVSRVVAGNPTVDVTIRGQVRKAAEKLGIDLEERQKGKARHIAFLLANRDALHPFQARVLLGAESYISQQNWKLQFMSFRYTPDIPASALHLPQLLDDRTSVRAAILAGTNFPNLLQALHESGIPFAVLGNNVDGERPAQNCDIAFSDDCQGAYQATTYLIAQGHRAIAFVGNLQLPWCRRCATGYERAMTAGGLKAVYSELRSDDDQLGYLATKLLLGNGERPTAILAGSDQVAAGVYAALHEVGISIPGEMSVIGFNDTHGSLLSPPLTSVREFPEELGRHLAEFAISRVRSPGLAGRTITIPTQLVLRHSVRARAAQPMEPALAHIAPAAASS